ncbi:bacillithiol biosynthesis deacetylase BshB1 [Evansella sp. AB-P1]|uniref:bacillithiol biosynthesis deacetylase BshB1 n=1 Tax=Evansella sp. AB-P1 TaxID=3037653 RepID=UPI00241EA35A|nr:bacillithiol biosynthesis deacetylase BshB1 [Evansella sp. AB-P1]MDG5787570.1 bacillithiol biosynthesis deacetylase BshB1 [Evansella sp. AB-P1]
MNERLDILAIGAHPDDVEIGMGGTLAKLASEGVSTGIVNLTKAELSSNGTVEQRQVEAENARKVLNVKKRIQLDFPDRLFTEFKQDCLESLVLLIRQFRPKVVFAPNKEDRHPDHGNCSKLVKEAVFSSGIKRYLPQSEWDAYRPNTLYFYQINGMIDAHFIVDISEYMDTKLQALSCYSTQFQMEEKSVKTPLNDGFIDRLIGRESILGNEVGVKYGEGFRSDKPLLISKII